MKEDILKQVLTQINNIEWNTILTLFIGGFFTHIFTSLAEKSRWNKQQKIEKKLKLEREELIYKQVLLDLSSMSIFVESIKKNCNKKKDIKEINNNDIEGLDYSSVKKMIKDRKPKIFLEEDYIKLLDINFGISIIYKDWELFLLKLETILSSKLNKSTTKNINKICKDMKEQIDKCNLELRTTYINHIKNSWGIFWKYLINIFFHKKIKELGNYDYTKNERDKKSKNVV